MIRRVVCGLAISILSFTAIAFAQKAENTIIMGEGFEKNQQSEVRLRFSVPAGWNEDSESAKQLGLYTVLVPQGSNLRSAAKVITIAFQKKDASKPGLDNLENFFKIDVAETLERYPNAEFVRWQPSNVDPDKIRFMSLEVFGKKKDQPSPQHFMIIDAGDGFFSVTLTANSRGELQQQQYDDFFNSISLSK